MFNAALIREIRRKKSIRQVDFAKLLAVSEAYLSMLEKGLREPSLTLIKKLVIVTEIPVEKWLSIEPLSESEETSCSMRNDVQSVMVIKRNLNRERRERQKAEERIWELEQVNERLLAEIYLREHYEVIICSESINKGKKLENVKKLAILTMEKGELSFDEIQRVLRVERSILRNWLEAEKRPYECRFIDGGQILASSPGEAALCLRCFECEAFEVEECLGYGDEKQPENIIEMLDRLRANGVYDGVSQARILEKYYGLSLSSNDIANIRYRAKKSLPIPNDVFYIDMRN